MPVWIAFALAWLVVRAFEQVGRDARTNAGQVYTATRQRLATSVDRRLRWARSRRRAHPARIALGVATVLWAVGRTTARVAGGVVRSAWTGGRSGWHEGRQRYASWHAKRHAPSDRSGPDNEDAPAVGRERRPPSLMCPECGEPVIPRPPEQWNPAWGSRPGYSHTDGEPLCPVITAAGYRPAEPVTAGPDPVPGQQSTDPTDAGPQEAGETTNEKGRNMPEATGEALNYEMALANYDALIRDCDRFLDRVDGTVASLMQMGVQDDTVGNTQSAMDAVNEMKAAFEAAKKALIEQHGGIWEAAHGKPMAEKPFYQPA